ncbi:FMRFamide-like neuropeptide 6 [Aphelenchoides besseyi]|nr:FMRFamide-like neuropeptide 6 [Aphelenchoides besseyi]KAI6202369.1 FMRFamide-like neuropeptide 6 [Aphelenchoides besseyi]
MFTFIFATLALAVTIVSAQDAPSYSAEKNLCERYPHLRICMLRENLDSAMNEILFLVQTVEQHQQAVQSPIEETANESNMQKNKRKSAFVRFGKRSLESMPDSVASNEEANPMNAMLNGRPTRKSSYIRFG